MRIQSLNKVEHFFKNLLLDTYLSIKAAKKTTESISLTPADTVVFVRLHKIGDALVAIPTMKAVKDTFGCRIVVVAEKRNHFIYRNYAFIDEVIVYRKGLMGVSDAAATVNRLKPRLLIDLHEKISTTSSLLVGQINAPFKISIRSRNEKLFTHTVPMPDPSRTHPADRTAAVLQPLGLASDESWNILFEPSTDAYQTAETFMRSNYPVGTHVVGVNISAGSEARFWGVENFKKLLHLLTERGLPYILITAPDDLERAKQIAPEPLIACFRDFAVFAAVISKVDLLFTPDTSAVHLASVWKVPVFGLYNKEQPGFINWYPYRSRYDWIIADSVAQIPFETVREKFGAFLDKEFTQNNTSN